MDRIEFNVIDSGPGIAPARFENLFDEFVQLDGSDTRQHGGAGLGLALTKTLADVMEGELSVVNRPEGGAIFSLRLPLYLCANE